MRNSRGFTLIELLIVVAIIAILAAIAVPNFLEAQVRSKVSRSMADMRSLATAIEAYRVDNNHYPSIVAPTSPQSGPLYPAGPGGAGINGPSTFYYNTAGVSSRFIWLTTPVAYITSVFRDPFINQSVKFAYDPSYVDLRPNPTYDTYDYVDAATLSPGGALDGSRGAAACSGANWQVTGCGPDRIDAYGGGQSNYNALIRARGVDYDPTNGTVSIGDLVRIGGGPGPLFPPLLPTIDRIKNVYNAVP